MPTSANLSVPSRYGFHPTADLTNLYILNLALADFVFCVVCGLLYLVPFFARWVKLSMKHI